MPRRCTSPNMPNRPSSSRLVLGLLALFLACGDEERRGSADADASDTGIAEVAPVDTIAADSSPADSSPIDSIAPDTSPADTSPGDSVATDTNPNDTSPADTIESPPNISVALDCGAGPPQGPGNANELQRHELDAAAFPDAMCNDGSRAVFYYRPYVGEANRDKWLINLNGGGGCGGGQSCADRWCWCRSTQGPNGCPFANATTNFSMANMNSDTRASIEGDGIWLRGDPERDNPMGDWNQVRVVYCSSDAWEGTRRDVPLDAVHPKTGAPVSYSIHFLGKRIIDAVLTTLRQDGRPPLQWTVGANPRVLPDLDDAAEVVLSGDSGGGAGVIINLDRVAATLRATNSACAGASCPLVVRGLMDAIVGPEIARLDFSASTWAELGAPTYELFTEFQFMVPSAHHGAAHDESCLAWHAANGAPGSEHSCADISHVVRHHVTTPFFVRMALLDQLISGNYVDAGWADPELGALTVPKFALILQRELSAFPDLATTAEEGEHIPVAPGVFAPACMKHDTIHSSADVYQTTITADAVEWTLFDVFENWRAGIDPRAVLTQSPQRDDTSCPGE